jgi:hypothetical protein
VVIAILGVIILIFLSEEVTFHVYALILYVLADFVVAGFVLLKPSKTSFTLAALWSLLRIVLFVGDISRTAILQASPAEENPLEFQVLELIAILQIAVIATAWKARSALIPQSTS